MYFISPLFTLICCLKKCNNRYNYRSRSNDTFFSWDFTSGNPLGDTKNSLGRTLECRKRGVCATHDLTKIRVRVLRSKDVLEKCKKGRLFLVVGAERDSPCKPLLATSYAESSLAFAAYRRYTFLGRAHLAKSRTM